MSNTKITVEFSSGDTRKFVASDELEKMIQAGEMFSFTTIHPDQNCDEIAKMYAGNPMAALGNMMVMLRNAQHLDDDDESKDVIIDVITACIKLLSDEITSYDSGLMPVRLVSDGSSVQNFVLGDKDNEPPLPTYWPVPYTPCEYVIDNNQCIHNMIEGECIGYRVCDYYSAITEHESAEGREDCPVINAQCNHYSYQCDSNGEVAIEHCKHPENSNKHEGNCTLFLCPLCVEGGVD